MDQHVLGVLRSALEPGSGEGAPQLLELLDVVDHLGLAGDRDPRVARGVRHVDPAVAADVGHLVRGPLGDEPQVGVGLDVLRGHRLADDATLLVDRGEHRDPAVLDERADLVLVLGHGRLLCWVGA